MTMREITPAFKDLMMSDNDVKVSVLKKAIESKPALSKAFNDVVNSYVDFVTALKEKNNGWPVLNLAPLLDDCAVPYVPALPLGSHADNPEVVGDMLLSMFEPDKPLKEEIAELGKVVEAYTKLVPKAP